MSNEQPNTHSNTPTSSTKDINLNIDVESKSPNISKFNIPLFSKSAIVFKPSSVKTPSNDPSLNSQQKKLNSTQKNNPNSRTLSTKFGSLIFPDQKTVKKKVSPKSRKDETPTVKAVEVSSQKIRLDLLAIAENPTPENIDYLFKKPLFLATLVNDGKIDNKILNSILPNISKDDLFAFMNTMTTQLTLHSSLAASYTFTDIEQNLSKILSFKKVLVWYKPYNSNFLISPTLKEIAPLSRSIAGYCALRQKKVITDDPAMSPGFDIDYDLPILRGTESMAIYPVISDYGDVSGVIQFVDLQSQDKSDILPISKYDKSLLKLAVKLSKRQIFKDEGSDLYFPKEIAQLFLYCGSGKGPSPDMAPINISTDQSKGRPSTSYMDIKSGNRGKNYSSYSPSRTKSNEDKITSSTDIQFDEMDSDNIDFKVNLNITSFDFENMISSMINFMKKYFDCDGVDIFEFDSSSKKFIRLIDGAEFSESAVGLSFLPIIKDEPVFVANGLQMGFPRSKLDKKFINNSALTVAYKYKYVVIDNKDKIADEFNPLNEIISDTNISETEEKPENDTKSNESENPNKDDENKTQKIETNLLIQNNQNDFNMNYDENENIENDPSIATSQYVFTLRSKWMLPSFLPDDLKKLDDISMILCSCIHNVQINRLKNKNIKRLQRENYLIRILGETLASYIDNKDEKWKILRKAAKDIFGASDCFVCSFDGMMIHFHPTEVTCKFDQCIAGKAFNFQELTEFVPIIIKKEKEEIKSDKHVSFVFDNINEKNDGVIENGNDRVNDDINLELYQKLGVSENLKRASAFHFVSHGKVKGSIELINPTYPEIDLAGQKIFGIICSVIHPF